MIYINDMDKDLTIFKGEFRETGFVPDPDLSWEEYHKAFSVLREWNKIALWALGELLNYGAQKFGERYSQLLDASDYDIDTLQRAKRIAQVFPLERRRVALSWGHHREVVDLPVPKQEVLLSHAEAEGLSVHRLRDLRRQLLSKGMRLPDDVSQVIKSASREAGRMYEFILDDSDEAVWTDAVTVLRKGRWIRCEVMVRMDDMFSADAVPDEQAVASPTQEADQ